MTLITGYYNSLNGDRKYNAETISRYFAGLFTRGVLQNYKDKFVVTSSGGMKVKIPTGKAFFSDGKWIENTADITLTVDQSDVILNRIDRIVLRNDKNEGVRNASIVLKKGVPASDPIAPALQIDSNVEEMSLCTIRINKLAESITQANITNTIPDTEVCGYVTGLINQVDTSDLYKQYVTAYKEFQTASENDFNEWFQTLKEKLATSTLLRQYTNSTVTTKSNQKVVEIGIPQYEPALDILNVYVNNLWLIEGKHYTKTKTAVTLTSPLEAGQDVYFAVFKSIDGEKATTVIEQVEELQQTKADKKVSRGVLSSAKWVNKKQTLTVDGVLSNSILIVDTGTGGVKATEQGTGTVTFSCDETPAENINVRIINLGIE